MQNKNNLNIIILYKNGKIIEKRLKEAYPDLTIKVWESFKECDDFIEDTDIIICWALKDEILKRAKNLKWIQSLGVGCEHLLTLPSFRKDITLSIVKNVLNYPIAEYVICYILSMCQKTFDFMRFQKEKKWDTLERLEVRGKVLGIIGLGNIGQEIAKKSKAFDMKVIGVNRSGSSVNYADEVYTMEKLNYIFKISDFITLALPLTSLTRDIIGEEQIKLMKPSAYLINISRGEILDELYLIKALKNKQLAGAVLDVFRKEPLSPESELWEIDNIIITPHVSWLVESTMNNITDLVIENTGKYIKGEKVKYIIDPEKGY